MTNETTIERGRWYPEMPPALPGETDAQYTDRLTGADGTGRRPYDHPRNRQCSIGWHEECSDPAGERCKCPCHSEPVKTLADVFAEEPPDGTRLAVWREGTEPYVVWRDDAEACHWWQQPDERWFGGDDVNGLPQTFRDVLAGATMVHAVVPLERSGLALVDEGA